MFEQILSQVLIFVAMGIMAFLAGRAIYGSVDRRRRRAAALSVGHTPAKPRDGEVFCADCGKRFIEKKEQNGFDPKTGQPRFYFTSECPNYSTVVAARLTAAAASPLTRSIFASVGYSESDWPRCGERTRGPSMRVGGSHNHSTKEDVVLECAACIDRMVTDGIVTAENARKLLQRASYGP